MTYIKIIILWDFIQPKFVLSYLLKLTLTNLYVLLNIDPFLCKYMSLLFIEKVEREIKREQYIYIEKVTERENKDRRCP